jgi:hypothetical protein
MNEGETELNSKCVSCFKNKIKQMYYFDTFINIKVSYLLHEKPKVWPVHDILLGFKLVKTVF